MRVHEFKSTSSDVQISEAHLREPKAMVRAFLFLCIGMFLLRMVCLPLIAQQIPAGRPAAPSPSVPNHASIAANYGKLPLSFEANQGQTDPQVRFLSRGKGYSLFLTDREAVLSLRRPEQGATAAPTGPLAGRSTAKEGLSYKGDVVRMELAGSRSAMHVSGTDKLAGTANYFVGNDPSKWYSSVPTFGKVKYEGVYPGVDLVYYGNQQQLEYDFVVKPGADAKAIRVRFAGAKKLKLDENGDLEVIAKNGKIAFHKPVVYQEIAGRRHEVEGDFNLLAKNTVAFALGDYDHNRDVVIDPTLAYSTYLGGSTGSLGTALTVDESGSVYVTGETEDIDFPGTTGFFQAVNNEGAGVATAFVTKINPDGSSLAFSTYLGGSGDGSGDGDVGFAIAVDSTGNSYITGYTYSSDFPLKNPYQSSNSGAPNKLSVPFVTKLNSTGTALVYSTYVGGSGYLYSTDRGDRGLSIAVNTVGNAYITGSTESTDFPITSGAYQTTAPLITIPGYPAFPPGVAFVTELNAAGDGLIYSTYLGGSGIIYTVNPPYAHGDGARGIAVDRSGDAYVTGIAASTDFPTTPGAFQLVNNGAANKASNAFLTKLNPSGSALIYSTYLGGSSTATPSLTCYKCDRGDGAGSVTIDSDGNAYIAGGTYSKTDFPTTAGAFQTLNNGIANAFVSKFNPQGTALLYSTLLGGSGTQGDVAYGLSLDPSGDVYLSGFTSSTNFPTTSDAFQASNNGAAHGTFNTFLTEVNPQGTALLYSTYLGGSGYLIPHTSPAFYEGDTSYSVVLDCAGSAYLTGQAVSPDFPVSVSPYQSAAMSPGSAFISKFNFPATSTCSTSSNPEITITTLASSANPAAVGTSVTFTATVAPTNGSGTPTGTVTFSVDSGSATAVSLNGSGQASYSTFTLTAGTHTIKASFSGDTNYAASSGSLSETISASSSGTVATPTFSPAAGTYASAQTVTITDSMAGAAIYYTTDGSTPTTSSTAYTGPITVSSSETIAAIAVVSGYANSATGIAQFVINLPPADFSIALSTTVFTLTSGESSTTTLTATPTNGFSQGITFSCSGLPSNDSCSFSPSTINPSGAPATTTLTVAESANAASSKPSDLRPGASGGALAMAFCWVGWRKRRRFGPALFALGLMIGLGAFAACGGNGTSPAKTTYNVTVTATSGSLSHTATFTVTQ